jgi:hypothetical protein
MDFIDKYCRGGKLVGERGAVADEIKYDEQKLKELIVYISAQSDSSDKFGMTKLNKLLFFSDFTAYTKLGKPITGATYIKMPFGPCPSRLREAIGELKTESRIFSQKLSLGDFEGSRIRAAFDPNLDAFTGLQISIVDAVIQRFWDFTGTEISDASHGFSGWALAEDREEIPYYTAMIPDRPLMPSAADMAEARRRAKSLFG